MIIGGLQKSSLIDFPEKISAIIFTQGCNFRCPYCHNPELVATSASHVILNSFQDLKSERQCDNEINSGRCENSCLNFLKSRIGKLDGVVITGGEPTLHKDLPDFIKKIKSMGFCVKLDTNGTNPDMIQKLLAEDLIDYIAMDIKAPIERYEEIVCAKVDAENILKSIEILKGSGILYEFRTTVVKSQLKNEDFEKIGEMIKNSERYYLQAFLATKTLDKSYLNQTTYSDEEFEEIKNGLQKYVQTVNVR